MKKAEIIQATLNGVYDNNSMCVLAKKCLTRFTHLLWIFVRAQGWVGHLSGLYQCEYVKPYTNVNIISFFRNCSRLYSLPVAMNVPVAKRPQRRGGGLPLVCSQGTYDPLRTLGGTPGNSWWGCAPRSPNPGPIYGQKMSSSTPVFRPDL